MRRKEYGFKDLFNKENNEKENEFANDIVFARYINYMRKALLNRRLNYLRHKKYLLEREISVSNEEWSVLSNKDKTDHFFAYKKDLKIALDKLNKNQREVIILYYYENKKIRDIAEKMNMSENAVKQLKLRAINKLKKYLEEENEK